ncbi:MAG: phosphatase PAP2 family protein [Candidatus Fimenecus sp.]
MDFSAFSAFDHAVFAWIQANIWCPFLDVVMPVITVLGEGGWFWIVVAVLFLFMKKYRKSGVTMAFALIVMLIVNDLILKNVFARVRPFNFAEFADLYASFPVGANGKPELLTSLPSSYSFPSGHTSCSFAAATAILLNKKWKPGVPALILAVLIGFSRNYLMVHYPTDVLFGALFGVLYAVLAYFLIAKYVYPPFDRAVGQKVDAFFEKKFHKKEKAAKAD